MKTSIVAALAAVLAGGAGPTCAGQISLEAAPPVVVRTMPVAGATEVDPALPEIRVTYSKNMMDGSWSWSTWGAEHYPNTTGVARYLDDARTCVLPVKLEPRKFYAIWLNSEKFHGFQDTSGRPAVPYLLTFFTGNTGNSQTTAWQGAPGSDREVNKLTSELSTGTPGAPDLATPETAYAAWVRAYTNKDRNGFETLSRLSLVPIDAAAEAERLRREQERDPEGLATYLQALAESKILVVQTWREELANVITFLPFPEGKGRHPFSARTFGRVSGEWKNLGEDRLPTLEAAKANFEKKKERLWEQFSELKAKSGRAEMSLPLNDDQQAVLAWTDRQFGSFFDRRTFDGWSTEERTNLERRLIDALSGPRSGEYYQAINTLAALRSTNALPKLRAIACEQVDRNNRDRWMSVRALGLIGDVAAVPDLIHLVYHGNVNTRWWAQITLVRLTGQNFAKDWNAWGRWWNDQNGQPPFKPEIIRWWEGQAEPDKLAASLDESDQKFLESLKPK